MSALQDAYSRGNSTLSPVWLQFYALSIEREQNNTDNNQIMSLIENNKRKWSTENACKSRIASCKKLKKEKTQESGMLYVLDKNGQLMRGMPTDTSLW
jgi:hypothetical protein